MIMQTIISFFATIGFSIIFNVPKKELVFCGLAGALGWLIYMLFDVFLAHATVVAAVFVAAIFVTVVSRFLSTIRKMPTTIYMIPGVIPLVPGAGIYFTMFYIITGENAQAMLQGVESLKIAGVIAGGLLIVLSLPRRWFALKSIQK
ncbi:MAG: threonine/serine exporter family protein [Defluviitaleaceae bacterium]|nr:threonine/serine exporter family protein [Defluviitaleaceae bacterium]